MPLRMPRDRGGRERGRVTQVHCWKRREGRTKGERGRGERVLVLTLLTSTTWTYTLPSGVFLEGTRACVKRLSPPDMLPNRSVVWKEKTRSRR